MAALRAERMAGVACEVVDLVVLLEEHQRTVDVDDLFVLEDYSPLEDVLKER